VLEDGISRIEGNLVVGLVTVRKTEIVIEGFNLYIKREENKLRGTCQ